MTGGRRRAGRAPEELPRLVLVHGATNGPWVFEGWADRLTGWDVRVPDLQADLDVSRATMADYAERVVTAARGAARTVVCGWSMGGLVALMAAGRLDLQALVVIEPSAPAEVGGSRPDVVPRDGTYEAADVYGPVAAGSRHRPESRRARDERLRGISVPAVACPLLVVAGRDHTATRGRPIAERYGGELLERPGLGHAALVHDGEVQAAIERWARRHVVGR